jgi:ATP-dependent Lon protease
MASKSKSEKLFKVAAKFNTSTPGIVDILSSKGHDIEDRPTTVINETMLNILENYFTEEETPIYDFKPKTSHKNAKHITISEGDSEVDFKFIFDGYIDENTDTIVIVDPYIRMPYQIENLMYFLRYVLSTRKSKDNLTVKLFTNNKENYREYTIDTLDKIAKHLIKHRIKFSFELDGSIHDRYVKIDNKWKIIMGRGFDIYKKTRLTEISNYELKLRDCKNFSITYIPNGSF